MINIPTDDCFIDPPEFLRMSMDQFREGLAKLPAVQREILQAHYIDGESIIDFAWRKRILVHTADNRRRLAIQRLLFEVQHG